MKTIKLLFFLAILPGFLLAQEGEFFIQGRIGSKTPVKVFLMYSSSEYQPDSTTIQNGTFSFKGSVSGIIQAFIYFDYDHTGMNFSSDGPEPDVLALRLSNESFRVTTADSIKNGIITGSRINDEAKILSKSLQGVKSLDDPKILPAVKAFIMEYPQSPICFDAMKYLIMGGYDYPQVLSVYESIDQSLRNSSKGQEVAKQVQAMNRPRPKIGEPAFDFTQNTPDGKPVSLKDFRGKYVLIDFWASWCVPCRKENPYIVAAYHKYKDKGFDILGVSLDNEKQKGAWLEAIEKDRLVWTQVSDLQGGNNTAAVLYDVKAIPSNFLVDPQGKIIAKNLRGKDLEAKLVELLGK